MASPTFYAVRESEYQALMQAWEAFNPHRELLRRFLQSQSHTEQCPPGVPYVPDPANLPEYFAVKRRIEAGETVPCPGFLRKRGVLSNHAAQCRCGAPLRVDDTGDISCTSKIPRQYGPGPPSPEHCWAEKEHARNQRHGTPSYILRPPPIVSPPQVPPSSQVLLSFLEEVRPSMNANYLRRVQSIDEELARLNEQLADNSISTTRREAIQQHIVSERSKLEAKDTQLQDFFNTTTALAESVHTFEHRVAEKYQKAVDAYIKAQLDEVVVPPDSRGNPKFKDSVDGIERELANLESENGGISNDSARARVASKRKSVEECESEHKRLKTTSVEYNLSILKGSLEKDKSMSAEDKRRWECVINAVGLLRANDAPRTP